MPGYAKEQLSRRPGFLPGVPLVLLGHRKQTLAIAASLFNRLPAGRSDPEANGLDRLGAGLHGLAFCSSKPVADEAGDHVAIEAMGAHKQRLGSTMRAAGE